MDLTKHHIWRKNVEVTEQILHNDDSITEQSSQLSSLNLAHNLFTSIPVVLPCLAVNLTKLNMAFNSLRSMSHITSYPSSLKQIDLSHNQITVWPSLPQVEAQDNMELANLACYMNAGNFKGKTPEIGGNVDVASFLHLLFLQKIYKLKFNLYSSYSFKLLNIFSFNSDSQTTPNFI